MSLPGNTVLYHVYVADEFNDSSCFTHGVTSLSLAIGKNLPGTGFLCRSLVFVLRFLNTLWVRTASHGQKY
jgi:hypothetical protein